MDKPKKLSVSLEELRRGAERAMEEDRRAHAEAPDQFDLKKGIVEEVDPAKGDL